MEAVIISLRATLVPFLARAQVVLLDEPSAGLDPVSRRNLWDVIRATMTERAVVLTTHSMEEAEALCARIGIMVKGQLRVVGTPQHLKDKFGSGYEIVTQLAPDAPEDAAAAVGAHLAGVFGAAHASLLSDNGGLLTFRVAKDVMRVGDAFATMEQNKARLHVADYSLAQPTLEQVFVRTVVQHSARERPGGAAASGLVVGVPVVDLAPELTSAAAGAPQRARAASGSGDTRPSPFTRATLTRASGDEGAPEEEADEFVFVKTQWCGLNRVAWRFLAFSTGLFAFALWISMTGLLGARSYDDDHEGEHCTRADDGEPCSVSAFYLNGLPLLIALIMSIVGCVGCCCCIPKNPDEEG